MRSLITVSLAAVVVIAGACLAAAQFDKSEDAIKYRQAGMMIVGQHFTRIGTVVKGQKAYDRDAFLQDATLVDLVSKASWDAFLVAGSAEGQTKMAADALKEPSKFKEAAKMMENEMAKLLTLAKAGALDPLKAQFGEVGKSCKNCHGQFRK